MTSPTSQVAPLSLGLRAIAIARSQIGVREVGNNGGADVAKYFARCARNGRRLGLTSGAWCASFASWCVWTAYDGVQLEGDPRALRIVPEAWSARRRPEGAPPIGYRAAVSELVADARACGALVLPTAAEEPLPGDLLIFGRDGQSPLRGGLGHVALCARWGNVIEVLSGNDEDAVRVQSWDVGAEPPWGPVLAWIRVR